MKIKIAVVGTGKVAREEYVPALADHKDVSLAYFNRSVDLARELAKQYPGEVFTKLEDVARWNPTSVMVLTCETARYEISKALIEAGAKKIFFEKPLVAAKGQAHVSEEDFHKGKELLQLARRKKCDSAIVFNYRFFDQTIAAKQAVEKRALGKVTNVTGLVHYACWSHAIDLMRYFAGEVEEISALAGHLIHYSSELKIEARDVAAALRLASGGSGTLIGTLAMKWHQPLYELIFTFENGRIHLRDLDGTSEILDGSTQSHEVVSLVRHHSRWDQYRSSFRKAVCAYLLSLRENKPPPVPAIEGLKELQFEAALRRSIQQHRPVKLSEEFAIDEV